MAGGDIAVNMVGQNNLSPAVGQAVGSLGSLNGAINQHMNRLAGETRAQMAFNRMLAETSAEMRQFEMVQAGAAKGSLGVAGGAGKAQMAINQLIFAVDDAATSYGTGGLAGAIRGAGNNLTMAASMMGPWGAAISVGVMAATQLGMALSKTGEEASNSGSLLDEFRQKVEALEKSANRIGSRKAFDPMSMDATEAGARSRELSEENSLLSKERLSLHEGIKTLEADREKFAVSHSSSPTTDVLGGLNTTDRNTFDEMGREIERMRERMRDIDRDRNRNSGQIFKIEQAMPDLQQREADAFGAQQENAEVRQARAGKAAAAAGREMFGEIEREWMKTSVNDPAFQRQGQKEEIAAAALRREDEINALTGVSQERREEMLRKNGYAAINRMTEIDRQGGAGLSARGPSAMRAGEADTIRFLNQARLGAAAKSGEERELSKLNGTNYEMLTLMRNQKKAAEDADPVVVVDF